MIFTLQQQCFGMVKPSRLKQEKIIPMPLQTMRSTENNIYNNKLYLLKKCFGKLKHFVKKIHTTIDTDAHDIIIIANLKYWLLRHYLHL